MQREWSEGAGNLATVISQHLKSELEKMIKGICVPRETIEMCVLVPWIYFHHYELSVSYTKDS